MRPHHGPQHVEVVNFSQRVLQIAQVLRPLLVQRRQEILHCVAQSLDADSKLVVGGARAIAQCCSVQLASVIPSLQREQLKDGAAQRNLLRTRA